MKATTIIQTPVILCADDFGISPGVNQAILDLAAKKRLSAVSCMSLGSAWADSAQSLKQFRERLGIGLHLTFTYLPPLVKELGERHPAEQYLLLRSWCRQMDKALIEKEMRAQFERFISVWQAPPDFIDGHQHVHVLPILRDIVLRLREQYSPQAWMRNVVDLTALTDNYKYSILAILGWRWQQLLKQRGIDYNQRLRGTYDYKTPVDYKNLMEKWCVKGPVLIYCHPGIPDATLAQFDTVLEPRQQEYDFLKGDDFGLWLQEKIKLVTRP